MSVPDGYVTIGTVVPKETRDRLHAIALLNHTSVSKLLAEWLGSGIDMPIELSGKVQSVRRVKDELMISLPRDWQRRALVEKGHRVRISYSDDALIVRR